jgi:hypothetical protein
MPDHMTTTERRREPRVAVELPLRFTFGSKTIDSRIVDLSKGRHPLPHAALRYPVAVVRRTCLYSRF